MDNNTPDCISEGEGGGEAVLLHDTTKATTMDFIREKSKQEDDGHATLSSCAFAECEGEGQLTCIDIMLPTLEGEEVQEEEEEEDGNSLATENVSKHNFYEYKENEHHQTDGDGHASKFESSEISSSLDRIVETSNIQVISVVMEQEAQTLHLDEINIATESDNAMTDDENLDSHIDGQEDKETNDDDDEGSKQIQDTISENVYEMDSNLHGGDDGDDNHDQYDDQSQYKDAISENVDDDDDDEEMESLQHDDDCVTECELNDDYTHLTNPREMQLSNETIQVLNDKQQALESHVDSTTPTTCEIYSHLSDPQAANTIHNKENDTMHLMTSVYRQKNIINMAAASANIDIDEPNEIIEVQQTRQTRVDQENSSLVQSSLDIENVEETDELVANHDGQIIMIEKEEESASEVIEEIYFIQDVGSSSDVNYEQDKNTSNSDIQQNEEEEEAEEAEEEEVVEEEEQVVEQEEYEEIEEALEERVEQEEEDEEQEEEEEEAHEGGVDDDYFKTSDNSKVKKSSVVAKSRNVIQDIFDDWRDENADEDDEMMSSTKDTVEIELNNLLNDDATKKPIMSKAIVENESQVCDNDGGVDLNNDEANVENHKETRVTSEFEATSTECLKSSTCSSSTTTKSPAAKKQTRNSTQGKDVPSYVQPYVRGTYSSSDSSTWPDQDGGGGGELSKKKLQSPRLGVKVPSRHLKSQIATPAEVTEVLKERLREKQKDLSSPPAADIVFVKKITQRFASKICAGGTMPVPALIPIQQSRTSDGFANSNTTATRSNDNPDNRELLAILEGDVDPDWSNLKPAAIDDNTSTTTTTSLDKDYSSSSSNGAAENVASKLDSAAQRELALKQLLEMPTTGNKRKGTKFVKKSDSNQLVQDAEKLYMSSREGEKEEKTSEKTSEINSNKKASTTDKKRAPSSSSSSLPTKSTRRTSLSPVGKPLKENDSQNATLPEFCRVDETRSGRKRKPTEKALELVVSKRQKTNKSTSPIKIDVESESTIKLDSNDDLLDDSVNKKKKKVFQKQVVNSDSLSCTSPSRESNKKGKDSINNVNSSSSSSSPSTTTLTSAKSDKNIKATAAATTANSLEKKVKDNISSSSIETRAKSTTSVTRRILSPQTMTKTLAGKANTTNVQNKSSSSPSTTVPLLKRRVGRPPKVDKSPVLVKEDPTTFNKKIVALKPRKKRKTGIKEIDKLLQDEGVVNLLYDVGQPRKRRLIPITKSQKKVMDIEKAERDLNLRKKLVKSTVLGLQNSDKKLDKIAYRTKRRITTTSPLENDDRESTLVVTAEKRKSSIEKNTEFIYPAKIRNAADASVIVRRHSSSSFSSVSGSPRVSVDSPLEAGNGGGGGGGQQQSNDETSHGLRSTTKRKQSTTSATDVDVKQHVFEAKRNKQSKVGVENSTIAPSNTIKSPKFSKMDVDNHTITSTETKNRMGSIKKQIKGEIDERNNKTIKKIASQTSNVDQDNVEKKVKVTTRSSGNLGLETIASNNTSKKKRINKELKSLSATTNNNNNKNDTDETRQESSAKNQDDELSACLAEAATALSSNIISNSSSSNTDNQVVVHEKISNNGASTIMGRKNKAIVNDVKNNKSCSKNITNSSNNSTHGSTSSSSFSDNKEINVCRHGNLVQLILKPTSTKMNNGITLKVMQELCDTLSILKTDDECRVVLFTSNGGTSFCQGLDLSTLLHTNKEKRRLCAQEMANAVKEFIKCLATFNKPLVAGVQGAAVGLGVTILPLFDLVIASDKATFYTPYGKLGQIPEGAAIMTLSHVHGSAVASELLLGGRTLTASEALRAGLVTRVLWPERFPLELLPLVKAMSEQSSQSMEATKALLRTSLRNKLNAALDSETHILVKQWCSDECQIAIKKYTMKQIE